MTTAKKQVAQVAEKILAKYPKGLTWAELLPKATKELLGTDIPFNTIWGNLSRLPENHPTKFIRKRTPGERDKYLLASPGQKAKPRRASSPPKHREEDFYEPFAKYLMNGFSEDYPPECTKAIPLGGNSFGKKWGTPDVIGIFLSTRLDAVKFSPEVVSAEIKLNANDLITGFGQACAYRQFSHKTYLVVPEPGGEDAARLESLCRVFGIGLVYFNPDAKPEEADFRVKLPAQKHSPDMFYVNQNIEGVIATDLGLDH